MVEVWRIWRRAIANVPGAREVGRRRGNLRRFANRRRATAVRSVCRAEAEARRSPAAPPCRTAIEVPAANRNAGAERKTQIRTAALCESDSGHNASRATLRAGSSENRMIPAEAMKRTKTQRLPADRRRERPQRPGDYSQELRAQSVCRARPSSGSQLR